MTEKWEKLSLWWILVRKWMVMTGQREFIWKVSQNGRLCFLFLYKFHYLWCIFLLDIPRHSKNIIINTLSLMWMQNETK